MPGTQEKVYRILTRWQEAGSLEPAKELFWSCLNYDRVNQPFSLPEPLSSLLAESPFIFAASGEFRIYYIQLKSDKLRFGDERRIIKQIYRQSSLYGMFIFSNAGRDLWHLVNARLVATGDGSIRQVCRRITIGPDEKLRTAAERLAHMEVGNIVDPFALQHQCDQAFDVEAVTAAFYNGYKQVFESLQSLLQDQTGDSAWAHDYALQILNRLMFLYFIQRKRWLGNNPEFIREFWEAYKNSGQPPDTFFNNWLSVLFFEAFNNGFLGGREDYRRRFPENIRRELALAPYLNGGLFKRNEFDQAYSVRIPDAYFGLLFDSFDGDVPGFLERYNFTVAEETPLDQEVAVDPEMIGKVYESLVNVSDEGIVEQDRRGEAGIFYTPRVEIDLMCRLSLADWLTNHLGGDYRDLLYELVFAYEPEEKEEVDRAVAKANLWPDVDRLLQQVAVLDPACGSGSFLVGMLLVLDDLQDRAGKQLCRETTSYERRRQIIGRSLYGVDVMPWAVHIAELRLWLQLVVDSEPDPVTAHLEPLLPNLSFKIRPGDSLLQEVGGINFALHRRKDLDISSSLKARLTRLQNKKLEYFLGKRGFTEAALKQEELLLFRDMLRERMKVLQEEIKKLDSQIESPRYSQAHFEQITEAEPVTTQATLAPAFSEQLLRRKRFLEEELERLHRAIAVLQEEPPFVWDLAFVEIFKGDKKGFDIVIGNPPYVRQEKIADPKGIYDRQTYKARLQETVAITWPRFFEYRESENKFRKLAGRSDLYVYFYLHGLSLLNEKGSFCFITSNSWLDVGYGKDLQEFLLRHGHVKLVVDNRAKRSFSRADVNTVIVLLGPADDRREDGLQETTRFAMFNVPFEEALSPVVFQEIAGTEEMTNRPEFRCIARSQRELYDEGLELPEDGGDNELARGRAKYAGGKWGGQYLRAPDIYFTILEKGRGNLVRLGDIATIRRGITTGANDFFYLEPLDYLPVCPTCGIVHGDALAAKKEKAYLKGDSFLPEGCLVAVKNGAGWEGYIEGDFLKPVVKSPREIKTIRIMAGELRYRVFIIPIDLRRVIIECGFKHPDKVFSKCGYQHAWNYIRWGEEKGYHRRSTCKARKMWWDIGYPTVPPMIINKGVNDRHFVSLNKANALCDQQLYEVMVDQGIVDSIHLLLNCTITSLFWEQAGRRNFGEGVLWLTVYEANREVMIPAPSLLSQSRFDHLSNVVANMSNRSVKSIFEELGLPRPNRDYSNIRVADMSLDMVLPDRRALDEVVFEVLGLTDEEKLAVYRAVVELVRDRLIKARSV